MGLLDKLKNALFEEEYVEVEEKPKKVKKEKPKKEKIKEESKEKPVAKKVILPGKKNVKVEELHEEELIDEDFEIRPKSDTDIREEKLNEAVRDIDDDDIDDVLPVNKTREDFKMLDDDDFKVENDDYNEPEIVEVIGRRSNNFLDKEERKTRQDSYDDYQDTYQESYQEEANNTKYLYGMSEPEVKVQDYGLYEKKEEKGYFRPSPIISPIYGILDRNYRKEDVVSKKDVPIASSYSRKRVDIDDVRNKAYGSLSDDIEREIKQQPIDDDLSFEVEENDEKRLVDLSADESKPTVKEVTVGDAVEYFQDLGLEYNVDYVDATKDKTRKRRTRVEENAEVAEKVSQANEMEEQVVEPVKEEPKEEPKLVKKEKKVVAVEKVESVEPVKDKEESDALLDTNDNLFDLIDSMYQENE